MIHLSLKTVTPKYPRLFSHAMISISAHQRNAECGTQGRHGLCLIFESNYGFGTLAFDTCVDIRVPRSHLENCAECCNPKGVSNIPLLQIRQREGATTEICPNRVVFRVACLCMHVSEASFFCWSYETVINFCHLAFIQLS